MGEFTNIFIIGNSGSGKTPVAKRICDSLGKRHVSASKMFRMLYDKEHSSREDFILGITEFSKKTLAQNYKINVDFLKNDVYNAVVEGIRNPVDFSCLFDFNHDIVIFLNHIESSLVKTDFEKGVEIIKSTVEWSVEMGITPKENVLVWNYSSFYGKNSLEENILGFISKVKKIT